MIVLQGIFRYLAHGSRTARILCGDFNSPKEEKEDGTVVPWNTRDEKWAAAEINIISGLKDYGLIDVYRAKHGYKERDYSYYSRPYIDRRFDHIFASPALLEGAECCYLHSWRIERLSDHSAIAADLNL